MSFKHLESSIVFIETLAMSIYIFNEIGVVGWGLHLYKRRRVVKKRMGEELNGSTLTALNWGAQYERFM